MDLNYTTEELAFRDEVRSWLRANLPDDLRQKMESYQELTKDEPQDMPSGEHLQRVLDAAAGLTRYEAEGAFALSLTRHNALRPEAISLIPIH